MCFLIIGARCETCKEQRDGIAYFAEIASLTRSPVRSLKRARLPLSRANEVCERHGAKRSIPPTICEEIGGKADIKKGNTNVFPFNWCEM